MLNEISLMLYVENVEESSQFWKKYFEFSETHREFLGDSETIKITSNDYFSIQFFEKSFILANSPEVSLETPSLLFSSRKFEELHQELKKDGYFVGEIVKPGLERVFNFADNEKRYFAVKEIITA